MNQRFAIALVLMIGGVAIVVSNYFFGDCVAQFLSEQVGTAVLERVGMVPILIAVIGAVSYGLFRNKGRLLREIFGSPR